MSVWTPPPRRDHPENAGQEILDALKRMGAKPPQTNEQKDIPNNDG